VAATVRGERTRRAFRDGARAVMARKGFLRTTVHDLAAAAGRSPGSFYNYYDNKEELLAELADEFRRDTLERARPAFRHGTPVRRIMEDSVRAYWESYRDHLGELVGVFQVAMIDEAFAERWRQIRLDGIVSIADSVRRAQREGYCPGIDPWLTAAALGSMFEHFCYVSLAQGGAFSDRPFAEDDAIHTIASIWYHALYWRPDHDTGGTHHAEAP
jgi:AcrR family transcriptional regulator